MSIVERAIRAVRDAESAAAHVSANMEIALHLIECCDSPKEALRALVWAAGNVKIAKFRIDEAIEAARKMDVHLNGE